MHISSFTKLLSQLRVISKHAFCSTRASESIITEALYGQFRITDRLKQVLYSDTVQRLKTIHQNGVSYLVQPKLSTSRLEHSIGAMCLASHLGGSEETQLYALLHDISHTPFSHFTDVLFDRPQQNYHDDIFHEFIADSELTYLLPRLGFPKQLHSDHYPMVKSNGQDITVDRLDYCFRDLLKMGYITHNQIHNILENLITADDIIMCKNIETARFLFQQFIKVNQLIYFNPKLEAASLVFKHILQHLIASEKVTHDDLAYSEQHILELINKSQYATLLKQISPALEYDVSDKGTHSITRKHRFINPRVYSEHGEILTNLCQRSKQELNIYTSSPNQVTYHIDCLNENGLSSARTNST